jgi:drug/metabolite transporter, DME family
MAGRDSEGALYVLAGGALWGTIGVFVLVMDRMGSTAELTGFLRMAFAFVILLIGTVWQFGWQSFRVDRRTLLACALLGLICQGIYNVFYNKAIVEIGITLSAVLLNLAPLCTMISSRILFGEVIRMRKVAAMTLCMAGCALTVTGGELSLSGVSLFGLLMAAGSGVTYGMTSVFGEMAGNRANVWVISTYSYLFAAVFLAVFTDPFSGGLPSLSISVVGFLYALIPTAWAYLLYYKGVQKITENSRVPVIASVETVVAALLGVFLFGEALGAVHILGIAMVMGSIGLMNGKG